MRQYHDAIGDASIFDEPVHRMLAKIVTTTRAEQHPDASYRYERPDAVLSDTLPFDGRGTRRPAPA